MPQLMDSWIQKVANSNFCVFCCASQLAITKLKIQNSLHVYQISNVRRDLSQLNRNLETRLPIRLIMTRLSAFIMFSALARSSAFVARPMARAGAARTFVTPTLSVAAEEGQAEVVLVGCGAPNRGMGWYHAVQMLEKK